MSAPFTIEVGSRVTVRLDYDPVQPTGTVVSIDPSVVPFNGMVALVALDHAEPGYGSQVVVDVDACGPFVSIDDQMSVLA